jgi:hypothetical protein
MKHHKHAGYLALLLGALLLSGNVANAERIAGSFPIMQIGDTTEFKWMYDKGTKIMYTSFGYPEPRFWSTYQDGSFQKAAWLIGRRQINIDTQYTSGYAPDGSGNQIGYFYITTSDDVPQGRSSASNMILLSDYTASIKKCSSNNDPNCAIPIRAKLE